ncbi:hypothetical protein FH603_5827 [Spirosoma sp. LMG 31447]|uniref:Uncharacterized protein n=1 Tax=Spirosoma utsteinense TaxID=2585773 RepID=A0ABR6WFI4_9BACT|nr:hypothetical protein [Spirosoma utsteinense]
MCISPYRAGFSVMPPTQRVKDGQAVPSNRLFEWGAMTENPVAVGHEKGLNMNKPLDGLELSI